MRLSKVGKTIEKREVYTIKTIKTINVLLIKFISAIIAFGIGLDLFFNATIVDILSFSLVVTVISYLLVDRIALKHIGNSSATVVDFLLTYMSVWIFGGILLNNYMQVAWGSILSAFVIIPAEILVHNYILQDNPDFMANESRQNVFARNLAFNTEFAEEQEANKKANQDKENESDEEKKE